MNIDNSKSKTISNSENANNDLIEIIPSDNDNVLSLVENRSSREININPNSDSSVFFNAKEESSSEIVLKLLKREQEIMVLENSIDSLKFQQELFSKRINELTTENKYLSDTLNLVTANYQNSCNDLAKAYDKYFILTQENTKLLTQINELETEKETLINELKLIIEKDVSAYKTKKTNKLYFFKKIFKK